MNNNYFTLEPDVECLGCGRRLEATITEREANKMTLCYLPCPTCLKKEIKEKTTPTLDFFLSTYKEEWGDEPIKHLWHLFDAMLQIWQTLRETTSEGLPGWRITERILHNDLLPAVIKNLIETLEEEESNKKWRWLT